MILELVNSPFDSHSNTLFSFIKKELIDSNIYNTGDDAYPYTDKIKKYRAKLSACTTDVLILINDVEYLKFSGDNSNSEFLFYFQPKLGVNDLKVVSLDKSTLYASLQVRCYNIHAFLAFISYKLKENWNALYQALANKYYDLNVTKDLDDAYLVPSPKATNAIAHLLGTSRYSQFSDAEYSTFLHGVFDSHSYGGTYAGIYALQQAFPTYFSRIDIIPWETYYGTKLDNAKKIWLDGIDFSNIHIYPNYIFLDGKLQWGILPKYDGNDSTSGDMVDTIYVDGDTLDGSHQQIKFKDDPQFYKEEYVVEEDIDLTQFIEDTDGSVTGVEGEYYFPLSYSAVDGTILDVVSTGDINVDKTVRFIENQQLNLLSLGTFYPDKLIGLKISYKTIKLPTQLGKIEIDDGTVNNLIDNQLNYFNSKGDLMNLSYYDNNFGAVVIVIRAYKKVDRELKNIVNNLIRNVLPIHLKYHLVFHTSSIWDYWGQTDITFEMFDSTGVFSDITFEDLK